jgi:hypothetical protein
MSQAHSRFSPSASHRWLRCPGSIKLSEGRPNLTSPHAQEGTVLHAHAAHWLETRRPMDGWDELDREQRLVVHDYLDVVEEELRDTGGQLLVETRLTMPKVHADCFGTGDAIIMNHDTGVLRVIDLKCGSGVPVQADYNGKINPQLALYALGALELWPATHPPPTDIKIVIVQPRAGGVKPRQVSLHELDELRAELRFAAGLADQDDAPTEAGPWCKFCPASSTCPTLQAHALETAQMEFGADPPAPGFMDVERIAEALDRANTMEGWIKSVRQEAAAILEDGGDHAVPVGACVQPAPSASGKMNSRPRRPFTKRD